MSRTPPRRDSLHHALSVSELTNLPFPLYQLPNPASLPPKPSSLKQPHPITESVERIQTRSVSKCEGELEKHVHFAARISSMRLTWSEEDYARGAGDVEGGESIGTRWKAYISGK